MQVDARVLGFGFLVGASAAMVACPFDAVNERHCWNARGDATCQELFGGSHPYCSHAMSPCNAKSSFGCVSEQPADECYFPCGNPENGSCPGIGDEGESDQGSSADAGTENADGAMTESDAESSETTDESECECEGDNQCATTSKPVCHDCECVACSEDDAAVCISQWKACNVDAGSCFSCDMCPEQVCNHDTGQCFVDAVHVDGGGNGDFLTIQAALNSPNAADTIILHEFAGEYTFTDEHIEVEGDFSIVAAYGERPFVSYDSAPLASPYLFEVRQGGSLYLAGFDIEGPRGIRVEPEGSVYLDSMSISTTSESALRVVEGQARVFNSMLWTVGDLSSSTVRMKDGASFTAAFNSIVLDSGGINYALHCDNDVVLSMRNSLIGTIGSATPSSVDLSSSNFVETNTQLMDWDWFTDDSLYLAPQFPAKGSIGSKASWEPGDPTHDIEGDERPLAGKTYAGADVVPP